MNNKLSRLLAGRSLTANLKRCCHAAASQLLSLRSLLLIGFLLAVLPVMSGLKYASTAMQETAELGRSTHQELYEQTKLIRLVLQKAGDIERKARLFVLFADPGLRQPYDLQAYENMRNSFQQARHDFLELNTGNKIALLVNELAEKENLIHQQIIAADAKQLPGLAIDEAFQGMHESAANLSREFENYIDNKFDTLRDEAVARQQTLFSKGIMLLCLAFVIILTVLLFISRAIKQLDISIDRLSAGDLEQPIVISGLADLGYLGHRLDRLRNHVLELEQSKRQFILNLVHELAPPLQAIQHSTQLLSNHSHDDMAFYRPNLGQSLEAQLNKLQEINSKLIQYSQTNLSLKTRYKQPVLLKNLVEMVLGQWQPQIQAKQLRLETDLQEVELIANYQQLHIIIEQLLANAVNFSPLHGKIRVKLVATPQAVEVEITDQGPGIAPEDRLEIFEPFMQGKASMDADQPPGVGLGLTLVREYVNNHRGRVAVIDAAPDMLGACLSVKIPLTR